MKEPFVYHNKLKIQTFNTILISILLLISLPGYAQQPTNSIPELLNMVGGHSLLVDSVIKQSEKYKLQIILTKIKRSDYSPVAFDTYDFTTGKYFYPASLVKLPVALLTLEILDSLHISRSAVLKMNKNITCGSTAFIDRSKKHNLSFNRIIEDMLVVSDNDYYNLLYHFLSPQEIKKKLSSKNLIHTNIFRSFSGCGFSDNLKSNSFKVLNNSNIVYKRGTVSLDSTKIMQYYNYSTDKLVGKYLREKDTLLNGPKDFNYNLEYPLADIHETLMRLIFPDLYPKEERWKISEKNRRFIIRCLGIYPSEMQNKFYHNKTKFPPNYYKYMIIGDTNIAEHSYDIRIIGKIGISYGFVTESAYIIDFRNKCDFFLTVSMYVNENDIINDGKYEYEQVARPFFAQLSRIISDQIVKEEIAKKSNDKHKLDKIQSIFR